MDSLFTHCSEAVCVAEDSSISFYAPNTLKKFRVEHFSGARICGLYAQWTPKGSMLHVVDAELHWHVVSLKKVVVEHSAALPLGSPSLGSAEVLAAHFYEVEDGLYSVIWTKAQGVLEVRLCDGPFSSATFLPHRVASRQIMTAEGIRDIPSEGNGVLFSVGSQSGLVVLGQQGGRVLRYSLLDSRRDAHTPVEARSQQRTLFLDAHSVICSPQGERVAVGGARGELLVFPSIRDSHHFSDHWHHTPLRAMSFSSDGSALITGAQEDVLLVWSMSTFSHRKIRRQGWGAIRCIVPSRSVGSTLLVASGSSTLSSVDLLEMSVSVTAEGIEWSAGEACSGFFFASWMGQTVAVLTGLPHVLRLADPLTQQSVYSLHVSSQLETLPTPPRHGIQLAAVLNEGMRIVTYEVLGGTVLPPQLCFWAYETSLRRHVLVQTIYSPHNEDVVSLQVDSSKERIFTLSHDAMKSWEQVVEDPNDALTTSTHRSWRNQSTSPTPSSKARDMALSKDGSLCFVADDSVHAYDIRQCTPGVEWQRVLVLSQGLTRSPLRDLVVLEAHKAVCARSESHVFLWPLNVAQVSSPHVHTTESVTAMTLCDKDELLLAHSDCSLTQLRVGADGMQVLHRLPSITAHPLTHLRPLPQRKNHYGVLDQVNGFRVVVLDWSDAVSATMAAAELTTVEPLPGATAEPSRPFQQFFATPDEVERETEEKTHASSETSRANHWLRGVLEDAPYTAPPMSTVLSQYLKQRTAPLDTVIPGL